MSAESAVEAATPGTCRWPIGDPKKPDFHFCAAPKETKDSYCAEHKVVAYRPCPEWLAIETDIGVKS